MNCRPYGSKPTLALWMLVALADIAILMTAAGAVTMLLISAGLFVVAAGVFAARSLGRPAPAKAAVRRRA
ncbi:hypothetical protein [Actinoplanes sp. NPDC020271]|uniref:hypothetical protein n=1 Tax=Actinoplanes sp. NPDC020271 TaxID=3363896 RepID=UPI0037A1EEF5